MFSLKDLRKISSTLRKFGSNKCAIPDRLPHGAVANSVEALQKQYGEAYSQKQLVQ